MNKPLKALFSITWSHLRSRQNWNNDWNYSKTFGVYWKKIKNKKELSQNIMKLTFYKKWKFFIISGFLFVSLFIIDGIDIFCDKTEQSISKTKEALTLAFNNWWVRNVWGVDGDTYRYIIQRWTKSMSWRIRSMCSWTRLGCNNNKMSDTIFGACYVF